MRTCPRPSGQSVEDLRPEDRETLWGTVGAVEDLEDFLLLRPELEDTCGVPVNLVPIITNGGSEEDHLRPAGDARGKFPCSK